MGRSYYKRLKSGALIKTGYSETDSERRKKDAGILYLALIALGIYCIYLFVMYLYHQTMGLIHSINDPSNLVQPYKFLAYYCHYLFFTPIYSIGYLWEVTVTNGLTKFPNINYIIFFSVLALVSIGCIYVFNRLKVATKRVGVATTAVVVAFPFVILIAYWIFLICAAIFSWIFT